LVRRIQFALVVFALLSSGVSYVLGQNGSKSKAQNTGLAAYKREMARQKNGFCHTAETTAAMNDCYSKELSVTEQNYSEYIHSIGELLRINPVWRLSGSHGYREFELAEAAWKTYKEQTCAAIEQQDDGASGAPTDRLTCDLTLTDNHMQELAKTYFLLWPR